MSEAELYLIRQRMLSGKLAKAERGELAIPLPIGYARRPSGEVILDPDEQSGHVQSPPDTPGSYTGTVTFQASGQNFTTFPASAPVTIAPRSSASVPLSIALPRAPGDAPESVQFTGPNGLESSVPIARRTLIRRPAACSPPR